MYQVVLESDKLKDWNCMIFFCITIEAFQESENFEEKLPIWNIRGGVSKMASLQ